MGTYELPAGYNVGEYRLSERDIISVVHLNAIAEPNSSMLKILSDQAQAVIGKSLCEKFEAPVPDDDPFLSPLTSPLDEITEQAPRIRTNYFLALQGTVDLDNSQATPPIGAVARLQHSRRRAHPIVTALETPDGMVGADTKYGPYAAAALHAALGSFKDIPDRKVAAYAARIVGTVDFYKELGFRSRTRDSYVNDSRDTHFRFMEARAEGHGSARNVTTVRHELVCQFPFLKNVINGVDSDSHSYKA